MNRTAAILALTLMLVTGLILGQLRGLRSPMPAAVPVSGPHTVQTAERFYTAVNTLLESGDPSSLRALLHPSFIDHAAAGEDSGTARDLEDSLVAVRASFPDLRLQISSTIPGGDLVASSLTATGNAQGAVNSIAVEAHITVPGLDLLRVNDGLVLERWASSVLPEPAKVETLASVGIDRLSSTWALNFERLDFERASSRTVSKHEGTVIIVESGSIGVHLSTYREETRSGTPAVPNSGDQLATGDIRLIPAASPFRLTTTGAQTASVLQVRIEALSPGDRTVPMTGRHEIAPGVTRELLAPGSSIRPNGGPLTLSIHRVTLSPQSSVAEHAIAETEIVWVMDGILHIRVDSGDVQLLTDQGTVFQRSGLLKLSSAQGFTGYAGAEVTYRAAGRSPTSILLMTLSPTDPRG